MSQWVMGVVVGVRRSANDVRRAIEVAGYGGFADRLRLCDSDCAR